MVKNEQLKRPPKQSSHYNRIALNRSWRFPYLTHFGRLARLYQKKGGQQNQFGSFCLKFVEAPCRIPAVPRKMRVEYADAICHLMGRGGRRADNLLDDVDRQDFLKTLAQACQKTAFQVHAHDPIPCQNEPNLG